jgi:hypothetical protein
MVDTAQPAGVAGTPLPPADVVPPVWGRVTDIVVDRGEES